jgi:murein DD-endopeptidase MepM/ murein hydrolase activator NlpD
MSMWKHLLRVTVFDESSYSEIRVFRGTPRRWVGWLVGILVAVSLATYLAIAQTPLREWVVPGYVAEQTQQDMRETRVLADSLVRVLEQQEQALLALRHALVGDEAALSFLTRSESTVPLDSMAGWGLDSVVFEAGSSEMALREAVEEADRFSLQRRRVGGANAMIGFTYPPLVGGVSDGMNAGIGHLGVDLVAPVGTPIQAVDDGSVLFSSYTVETGYTLLIQHRGERVSVYKHCSSLLKQQGDLVAGGEAVGLMGNTGELTTGPHLHFEWWVRGRALDPTPWLGRTSLWDDGGPVN